MREGVDLTRFDGADASDRAARRRRLDEHGIRDVDDDTRIITCVARLHPLKGLDNLLLAAREVLASRPAACRRAGGANWFSGRTVLLEKYRASGAAATCGLCSPARAANSQRLQTMSRELKIDDRVHFLGHVQDVPGLLAASDLFCYPSLADGLPNAVVEAMAMGLPVIASAVGGVPELIADGENGLLVAPQDVRQLTRSIARLLDDEALAARLGAQRRDVGAREARFQRLLRSVGSVRRGGTRRVPAST